MVNTRLLRAAMISAGYDTIKSAADAIGMPETTMYRRLESKKFDTDEMKTMVETYKIDNPIEIFFAD